MGDVRDLHEQVTREIRKERTDEIASFLSKKKAAREALPAEQQRGGGSRRPHGVMKSRPREVEDHHQAADALTSQSDRSQHPSGSTSPRVVERAT
jgi:hypothetical protein